MTWSARIEGDVWRLYQGDRMAFMVDGLRAEAHVDVATIVNALNAYGPSNALMREIAGNEFEMGKKVDGWMASAKQVLVSKSEIRAVTMVEIGNVPAPEIGE